MRFILGLSIVLLLAGCAEESKIVVAPLVEGHFNLQAEQQYISDLSRFKRSEPYNLVREAKILYQLGDHEKASDRIKNIQPPLLHDPDYLMMRVSLARENESAPSYQAFINSFESINQNLDYNYLIVQASIAYHKLNYASALTFLTKAYSLHSGEFLVNKMLSDTYVNLLDTARYVEHALQWFTVNKQKTILKTLEKQASPKYAGIVLDYLGTHNPDTLLAEWGAVLLKMGSMDDAKKYFDSALTKDSLNFVSVSGLVKYHARTERYDSMYYYSNRLLTSYPDSVMSYILHGYALKMRYRYDEALLYLDTALMMNPASSLALENKKEVVQKLESVRRWRARQEEVEQLRSTPIEIKEPIRPF